MASAAKPHRHPQDSGYQRGEETRARIISVALRLFGEKGFDGASTRDIAAAAGVNAPALQYYFDSKEGVYVACMEHIVSRMWEYTSQSVERAERLVADDADDETLIEAFCEIQARLADFMFTAEDASDWRLFMARHQAGEGPVAGFQILEQSVKKRVSGVTSTIVGRLLGKPATDDETRIRTMALNGQLMVFQVVRRSALTALNWKTVDKARLDLLKGIVGEQTKSVLRSLSRQRSGR